MSDLLDRAVQKARRLPEAEQNVIAAIIIDGFLKNPTSALRCIPRHCNVL